MLFESKHWEKDKYNVRRGRRSAQLELTATETPNGNIYDRCVSEIEKVVGVPKKRNTLETPPTNATCLYIAGSSWHFLRIFFFFKGVGGPPFPLSSCRMLFVVYAFPLCPNSMKAAFGDFYLGDQNFIIIKFKYFIFFVLVF